MRGLLAFILATLARSGVAADAHFFQLCRLHQWDEETRMCDVVVAASFRELQDRTDALGSTEPPSGAVDELCLSIPSQAAAVGATLWRADSDDDLLWLDSEEALDEIVRPHRGDDTVSLKWRQCFVNHSIASSTFAGDTLANCPGSVRVGITDAGSMLKVCADARQLTSDQLRHKCTLVRLPCMPHCDAETIIAAAQKAVCGSGAHGNRAASVTFDARSTDEKISGSRGTQRIRLRDDDGARYFFQLNQRHWAVQQQIESLSIPSSELSASTSSSHHDSRRRLYGPQQDHYVNVPSYDEPRQKNMSAHVHARRIRENILNEMDIMVSPNVNGLAVNVSLYIHVFKAFAVNVPGGTLTLSTFVHLFWTDVRLAWDPAEYGGVSSISVSCDVRDVELPEIWIPDVDVTNAVTSMQYTLATKPCIVNSDGSVVWKRPGLLALSCMWKHVSHFPFDHPTCYFEFGATALTSHTQLLSLDGAGVRIFSEELLGGSAFQDFTIKGVSARPYTDEELEKFIDDGKSEAIGGEHDDNLVVWPTLLFSVTLDRASRFFVVQVCLPMVLFAYLSFGAFWINVGSGERLGFGITLILAMVAFDLWTSDYVPKCSESIFLTELDQLCGLAATLSLVQSMVVLFLFFKEDGSILPDFVRHFQLVRKVEKRITAWRHHSSHAQAKKDADRHQRSSISLQHIETVTADAGLGADVATVRRADAPADMALSPSGTTTPSTTILSPKPASGVNAQAFIAKALKDAQPPAEEVELDFSLFLCPDMGEDTPPYHPPHTHTPRRSSPYYPHNAFAPTYVNGCGDGEDRLHDGLRRNERDMATLAVPRTNSETESSPPRPATQENVAVKDITTAGKDTTDSTLTDGYLREHPLSTMPVAGLVTLGKVFYHSNKMNDYTRQRWWPKCDMIFRIHDETSLGRVPYTEIDLFISAVCGIRRCPKYVPIAEHLNGLFHLAGFVNRQQFIMVVFSVIAHIGAVPVEHYLELKGEVHAQQLAARQMYWKSCAGRLDEISRFLFPTAFTILLLYMTVKSGTHHLINEHLDHHATHHAL